MVHIDVSHLATPNGSSHVAHVNPTSQVVHPDHSSLGYYPGGPQPLHGLIGTADPMHSFLASAPSHGITIDPNLNGLHGSSAYGGSGCIDAGATAHIGGGVNHGGVDITAHGGGCASNLSGDPTFGGHPQFGGFEGGISVTVPIGSMPIF